MTDIPRAIRADVKVVSYVRKFRQAFDRGPSLREIMLAVDAGSKTTVSRTVRRLIAAGRLVKQADGPAVPGDVEAAVALLIKRGWHVASPGEVERNGNYAAAEDMAKMLRKLD